MPYLLRSLLLTWSCVTVYEKQYFLKTGFFLSSVEQVNIGEHTVKYNTYYSQRSSIIRMCR